MLNALVTAKDTGNLIAADIFTIDIGDLGMTSNGTSGSDMLAEGTGNDTLNGLGGNDVYIFGRNYGMDTLIDHDSAPGNFDIVRFLPGISADQIWFQRAGNNLEASVIGTTDKVVINDWYLGSANHIERFKTSDGRDVTRPAGG
ncbi:calcium-binding protein [Nitrosomonas sp. Is35]|uniref:calcium-binding protein n=1 Tax=Nitrosomonas sp. Is35 TaxID=3080534 RepID=UPI00294AC787|nr:calcium-binding protein [Nitrosomonas sp. Is35]MDV6347148.1 calcium-binding protein [Nitrosomonas sp. Is35]